MLSYKFRIYPSKTTQQKLDGQLELCRWLYNHLLEILNKLRTEGRRLTWIDTQALIVKLKEENPKLKQVYSTVLKMVNYQLWSSIKALARLKKRGRKVGRLRFKGRGWFKTLNPQSLWRWDLYGNLSRFPQVLLLKQEAPCDRG